MGGAVAEFFMPDRCHRILYGIFDDVLSEARANAFSKTLDASAPFVGAVSQLLNPRAGPGANRGPPAKGIFYILVPVGMAYLGRLRRGGDHKQYCYEL